MAHVRKGIYSSALSILAWVNAGLLLGDKDIPRNTQAKSVTSRSLIQVIKSFQIVVSTTEDITQGSELEKMGFLTSRKMAEC